MPRRSRPWLDGITRPFQRRRAGVARVRDVPYGPDSAHRLDVYRSASPSADRPLLIHFHEGGFVQGGKSRESVTLLNQLAARAVGCAAALEQQSSTAGGAIDLPMTAGDDDAAYLSRVAATVVALGPDHEFEVGLAALVRGLAPTPAG